MAWAGLELPKIGTMFLFAILVGIRAGTISSMQNRMCTLQIPIGDDPTIEKSTSPRALKRNLLVNFMNLPARF